MLKRKDRKAREIKGWGGGFNFQWLPQEGSYEGVTLETKISIREDHALHGIEAENVIQS